MGKENSKIQPNNIPIIKEIAKNQQISKTSFEFVKVIGSGGFGKVWKVYCPKYKKEYAMKQMSKVTIIDEQCENHIKYERDLLGILNHPFIVNLQFAFQDKDYVYLVMDLLTGGDLRFHLARQYIFDEEQTKFIMACIILSLDYIHSNNIIHRDIKPENLVFDQNGYLKLTDFGIAKLYRKENRKELSGTPGYMAPEVMTAQNHTIAVDYFALGVIGYELMMGKRPYVGQTRQEIKVMMLSKQVQIKKHELPRNWSINSAEFINGLLQRKPANRLGLRGATEIKEHAWFNNFQWQELYCGRQYAPYIPEDDDNYYSDFFDTIQDKPSITIKDRYAKIMSSKSYKECLKDFHIFNRETKIMSEQEKEKIKTIKNPHVIYTNEKLIDFNGNVSTFKKSQANNHIIVNRHGMSNEQYLILRRMSNVHSSRVLHKQYNNLNNSSGRLMQNRSANIGSIDRSFNKIIKMN